MGKHTSDRRTTPQETSMEQSGGETYVFLSYTTHHVNKEPLLLFTYIYIVNLPMVQHTLFPETNLHIPEILLAHCCLSELSRLRPGLPDYSSRKKPKAATKNKPYKQNLKCYIILYFSFTLINALPLIKYNQQLYCFQNYTTGSTKMSSLSPRRFLPLPACLLVV